MTNKKKSAIIFSIIAVFYITSVIASSNSYENNLFENQATTACSIQDENGNIINYMVEDEDFQNEQQAVEEFLLKQSYIKTVKSVFARTENNILVSSIMIQSKQKMSDADIIFIIDGICEVLPELNKDSIVLLQKIDNDCITLYPTDKLY